MTLRALSIAAAPADPALPPAFDPALMAELAGWLGRIERGRRSPALLAARLVQLAHVNAEAQPPQRDLFLYAAAVALWGAAVCPAPFDHPRGAGGAAKTEEETR